MKCALMLINTNIERGILYKINPIIISINNKNKDVPICLIASTQELIIAVLTFI